MDDASFNEIPSQQASIDESASDQRIDVDTAMLPKISMCTLGMFIIDEIEYTGLQPRQESVIGGAGTYATIGARIAAGRENAASIGWILDMGVDFPADFQGTVQSWNTSCLFRQNQSRMTTRAWNGYGPGDHRAFKYLTPKVRLDEDSLSEGLLASDTFHLVCSPERCESLVDGILGRLNKELDKSIILGQKRNLKPIFIWEPLPDLCTPQELGRFKQATQRVDVVSPNSEELVGFFAGSSIPEDQIAKEVLGWGIGPSGTGALVVRQGKQGCTAHSKDDLRHLRAYHLPDPPSQSKVIDPTGGGNAFLGALAIALSGHICPKFNDLEQLLPREQITLPSSFSYLTACLIYATVAASFVIEQPGMPCCGQVDGKEVWNGEEFKTRLETYLTREKAHPMRQLM